MDKTPWAFSSPRWCASSPNLFLNQRCSSPFIIFVTLHWPGSSMAMSLLYWRAQHQTQHSRCASAGLKRGEGSVPWTCWWPLPVAALEDVSLCRKGTVLVHGQFVTQQEAQSLFCRADFQPFIPQGVLETGVVPQLWDFAFQITELPEVPFSPFLQPTEILLDGSTSVINCSSQFYVSSRVWRVRNRKVWAQAAPYQLNSEPEVPCLFPWLMMRMEPQIKVCCRGVFLEQAQIYAVQIPEIRRWGMSLLSQLLPCCCVYLGLLVYFHYHFQIYSICSACACEHLYGSDLVQYQGRQLLIKTWLWNVIRGRVLNSVRISVVSTRQKMQRRQVSKFPSGLTQFEHLYLQSY